MVALRAGSLLPVPVDGKGGAVIHTLATCEWVKKGQPLCLIGDSGTGKSHLLIALGTEAAMAGYRVRYTLATKLVNELVEAADDRQLSKTIARYGRVDLLCIDELGYMELDRRGAELLFQVLTEREEKASVAIASNDSFGKAHRFPATCARWDRAFTGSGGRAAVPAVAIIGRAARRSRRQLRSVGPDRVAVARWCWLVTVRARRRSGGSPWGWDPRGPGPG